jgi:hypothetical protein
MRRIEGFFPNCHARPTFVLLEGFLAAQYAMSQYTPQRPSTTAPLPCTWLVSTQSGRRSHDHSVNQNRATGMSGAVLAD